jgi:protein TonB
MRLAFLLLVSTAALLFAQAFSSLPAVVQKVDPEYTREAAEAKIEGLVTLTTTVSPDGTPSDIRVIRGLGRGLDEKAVECLNKWRFRPGTRDAVAIPVRAHVQIRFRLPEPPMQLVQSK